MKEPAVLVVTPFPRSGATIFPWMQDLDPLLPSYIDHDAIEQLPPMTEPGMPATEITIAELLKGAGDYTAHIDWPN